MLFALACAPAIAHAQEGEGEEPQADGETPYEPDQRGEHEDPEPQYEPDQRGEHGEEGESEQTSAPPEPTVDAGGSAELASSEGRSASGIGVDLALWLGASVTALDAVGDGNLVRSTQEGSFGATLGFTASMRFGQVAIGPRVMMILDPSFVLANLGIGAQVMLLPDDLTPFVSAAIGGTIVTGLGDPLPSQGDVGIFGIGAELGGGVRWQASSDLVVGAELAAGWHHLWRDAVPACEGECSESELDLRTSGESDGLTLRLSLFAGYAF